MSTPSLSDVLEAAVLSVRAAGRHALDNSSRRGEIDVRFDHDVKLRLDRECQDRAEDVIRSIFPAHTLFGEEGGEYREEADYLWIIDPLDGTVNYFHGVPLWGSSVACQVRGEIVAGAIFLPVLDECFTATTEHATLCNGKPVQTSSAADLADSLVLTGLSHNVKSEENMDVITSIAHRARKIRVLGSASVDFCLVASGRAEAYFESSLHLWDWAAGGLIVQQAGAHFEVLEHYDAVRGRTLAVAPGVAQELRALVAR